ncbi:hypothetical protein JTB14_011189 [Gonioctena quinquepunctata]|nr:hypothetical protein JTB14_011189 [Gonioctena quinquepunctata]
MGVKRIVLAFFTLFFVSDIVRCTEYVPVYMWSIKKMNEKVPALNKVSQGTFEYEILERLKDHPLVVVFKEETLSPEDFAQHDSSSGKIFPHLAKLAKSSKVMYLPYVQNPIKALKNLDVPITEVPLERIDENFEIPETDILIVNLDDVKDSETRIEMLKRHDAAISPIFKNIIKSDKNVLAIYTADHTSWVASEEVVNSRQRRSLLAAENEPVQVRANASDFWGNDAIYLYLTQGQYFAPGGKADNVTFTYEATRLDNGTKIQLSLKSVNLSLSLHFTNMSSTGYWILTDPVSADFTNKTTNEQIKYNLTSGAPLYAPTSFSYHCGDQRFSNPNFTVTIKNFQIQVFFKALNENATQRFGDAYDCVGFTSVPIWSGLFVTLILLMIMTTGITMMMDIRTMDRFDDPKGKTITINAE